MNITNENEEQIKLINLEGYFIVIFIISLNISLLLNHNNKLRHTNQQTILTHEEAKLIAIANAIAVVCATCGELFLVLKNRELILQSNGNIEKIELSNIEIIIGVIAVIVALMELFVIIKIEENDFEQII